MSNRTVISPNVRKCRDELARPKLATSIEDRSWRGEIGGKAALLEDTEARP